MAGIQLADSITLRHRHLEKTDIEVLEKANSFLHSWQIPVRVFEEVKKMVADAPVNEKTGRRFILFSVVNSGHIRIAMNLLCTMRLAQFPSSYHFLISLDEVTHRNISKFGGRSIFLPSNFTGQAVTSKKMIYYCDIIKVKPIFAYLLLLMNVEPIIIDTDIIVLESDFLSEFTDAADIECQSDSKLLAKIPSSVDPPLWEINMGFVKFHPTPTLMNFMPLWLNRSFASAKVTEQRAFKNMLVKEPRHWINSDTFVIDSVGLTIRYLDPVYISNCGLLFASGSEIVKEEARKRGIWKPKLIHCFHIQRLTDKIFLMKGRGLYYEKGQACLKEWKPRCLHWDEWHGTANESIKELSGKEEELMSEGTLELEKTEENGQMIDTELEALEMSSS
jgi:hypothetical protein